MRLKNTVLVLAVASLIGAFVPVKSVFADMCPTPNQNPCWITKTPMPTARRDLGVAADATGKIYAVGGYNGQFLSTLEMYDPTTDTWTTKTSAPVARNDMGFTFNPANGKFYFGGGYNNGSYDDFFEYDPATDTWTRKATMPTASTGLRFAAANGKIYAIGGGFLNGTYVSNVEEYDPATDTWTTKSAIPTPRSDMGLVTASDGKLYFIGGGIFIGGSGASTSDVNAYDPATDTWTTKASLPAPIGDPAASLNANGNIYIVGGYNEQGQFYNNTVYEYNPTTDTWTTDSPFPVAINSLGGALGGDGKVYVLGGWTSQSGAVNTNYAGLSAPLVGAITTSANPVQVNTSLTSSANFTDGNTSGGPHTAIWNWGDQTPNTTGTVTEPNGSNPGTAGPDSHTYTTPGVYTITLTVTNNPGATGTSVYQYVAVYDSSTAFAGGRSYDNPTSASPNTSGKVMFGISSKYNNSNVLTGSVKMNFKAANLDFASTSLSSLATSNGRAYLKGAGTLNGVSGYTFLATGIDGSVAGGNDLIRFQIKQGTTTIYDSQPGAGDTADPTTVDATGNIRVH